MDPSSRTVRWFPSPHTFQQSQLIGLGGAGEQPPPLERGCHFCYCLVRLCVLLERDHQRMEGEDACPEKCLETDLQRGRRAFVYGTIFSLHRLEGWAGDSL